MHALKHSSKCNSPPNPYHPSYTNSYPEPEPPKGVSQLSSPVQKPSSVHLPPQSGHLFTPNSFKGSTLTPQKGHGSVINPSIYFLNCGLFLLVIYIEICNGFCEKFTYITASIDKQFIVTNSLRENSCKSSSLTNYNQHL